METPRIGGLAGTAPARPEGASRPAGAPVVPSRFAELLSARIGPAPSVQFSKHAEQRMVARRVELEPEARGRLEAAVRRAADKGARDSLVLLDRMAFVVNVPSRTVLTAMTQEQAREGVFTKIDSTVLA